MRHQRVQEQQLVPVRHSQLAADFGKAAVLVADMLLLCQHGGYSKACMQGARYYYTLTSHINVFVCCVVLQVSDSFPFKWINKKWKEGFYVTSMATSHTRWAVVMSRNAGFVDQVRVATVT
jgi:hypothetical protein